MKEREQIIINYLDGYNKFDIGKMVKDFDENIVFENISNGNTNMLLKGLTAFKEQGEQTKNYFSERMQTILSYEHLNDQTVIEINYYAILANDFPNGLKKGNELKANGKSIFKFSGNKIIKLTDIS